MPFLPFALPEIGDEEIAEVVDTLKSGWVTTGPKAKRFEADFAAFLGDAGDGGARGRKAIAPIMGHIAVGFLAEQQNLEAATAP